jgi:hypothetical protein
MRDSGNKIEKLPTSFSEEFPLVDKKLKFITML